MGFCLPGYNHMKLLFAGCTGKLAPANGTSSNPAIPCRRWEIDALSLVMASAVYRHLVHKLTDDNIGQ